MEKVTLEEEFIVQEKIPTLSIKQMIDENMAEKDAEIQAILSKTNYAALLHHFIHESEESDLYMRLAKGVRKEMGSFTRKQINHAVQNEHYAFSWWDLNGVFVFGYSKNNSVSQPSILVSTVAWNIVDRLVTISLFAFMVLLIAVVTFAISSTISPHVAWLNLLFFISVILFAIESVITFIILPLLMCIGRKFNFWERVDMSHIQAFPLLDYTENQI